MIVGEIFHAIHCPLLIENINTSFPMDMEVQRSPNIIKTDLILWHNAHISVPICDVLECQCMVKMHLSPILTQAVRIR